MHLSDTQDISDHAYFHEISLLIELGGNGAWRDYVTTRDGSYGLVLNLSDVSSLPDMGC